MDEFKSKPLDFMEIVSSLDMDQERGAL